MLNNHDMADENELVIAYRDGTQRVRTPAETLEYINPKLPLCGITRAADITKLDNINIPTFCAIRPTALVLQVSNGKGATTDAAKVSALMESVELFHIENSDSYEFKYQAEDAFGRDEELVDHKRIDSYPQDKYYSESVKMNWYKGKNVMSGQDAWIPASAVFFDQQPSLHGSSTNGLASGNHVIEASLHALYELIERDTASRLSVNGKLKISDNAEVINSQSVHDPQVRNLIDLMNKKSKVVLCYIKSPLNVYTFWAILLNRSPMSSLTALNLGWGTHRDKAIAASRALTEAAQSRLTAIHGAREDLIVKAGYNNANILKSKPYLFIDKLKPTMDWQNLPEHPQSSANNLGEDWRYLLSELKRCGYCDAYQFDLTRDDIDIPVVKMIVPKFNFNSKIF
jgi:ribosomal protein S12 methylthiotransferase accessory factor